MNTTDPIATRSNAAIISDLLRFAVDREWSGQRNFRCGCHPEYEAACPSCDEFRFKRGREDEKHDSNCELASLIEESRAFLRVENEIIEARNDPDESFLEIA